MHAVHTCGAHFSVTVNQDDLRLVTQDNWFAVKFYTCVGVKWTANIDHSGAEVSFSLAESDGWL